MSGLEGSCRSLIVKTMLKRATRTAVTSSALNVAEDERREEDELVEVVVSSGNEMSEGARRKQPARASLRKQATASEEVQVNSRCRLTSVGVANVDPVMAPGYSRARRNRPVDAGEEEGDNQEETAPTKRKKYTMVNRNAATVIRCHYCDRVVRHPSKIAEHMRTHTGEKPFKCEICGIGFTQGHPMKVHMLNHRGEKPYECRWRCGRGFTTAGMRTAHERQHTGERIYYRCPVVTCGARYAKKSFVREHVIDAHPDVDMEQVGLGAAPSSPRTRPILIDTVEQLIATVQDPDDVAEEAVWLPPDGETAYEGGGIIETNGMIYVDDATLRDDDTREVVRSAITSHGDDDDNARNETAMIAVTTDDDYGDARVGEDGDDEGQIALIYDPQTRAYYQTRALRNRDLSQGEESLGGDFLVEDATDEEVIVADDDDNTHDLHAASASRTNITHMTSIRYFEDDLLIDADDAALQPTAEEEVVTTVDDAMDEGEYYAEEDVDEGEVDEDGSYIYMPPPTFTYVHRNGLTNDAWRRRTRPLAHGVQSTSMMLGGARNSRNVRPPPLPEAVATYANVVGNGEPIIADARAPRRGRRRERAINEEDGDVQPVSVDPALYQMAAPLPPRPTKQMRAHREGINSDFVDPLRPARNLDWIIDAVARGVAIDHASPHNRKKPVVHQCEFCGKVDKYPSKIKAHMRIHTGEKPFICSICGMGFAQKTPMRMHLRRHLNQKPYECGVCGTRFVNGALLNAHYAAKHLGLKRFICMRGCGKTFTQRRQQLNHEAICRCNDHFSTMNAETATVFPAGELHEQLEVLGHSNYGDDGEEGVIGEFGVDEEADLRHSATEEYLDEEDGDQLHLNQGDEHTPAAGVR